MKAFYRQIIAWLGRSVLEWKFLCGAGNSDLSATQDDTTRRYEEVEEVCLRRGQRSRRLVRRMVEES